MVAQAAATVQQLEALQIKDNSSVTIDFDTFNINNPLNKFKYRNLLKTEDKAIWEKGRYNKLGRLS